MEIYKEKESGKLSAYLGTVNSPDISDSIARILQKKYNAKIINQKITASKICKHWLFEINGFEVGLMQDDIMPLGIYAKTIEANDLVNRIADDLEPLIKDIKDEDF